MRYQKEIDGVEIRRDRYFEQHAQTSDMKTRYHVLIEGEFVYDEEDVASLSKKLRKTAKRLLAIADFLSKKTAK